MSQANQLLFGSIHVIRNEAAHKALVYAIAKVTGIFPTSKSTSKSAVRAHYDKLSPSARMIINNPSDAMWNLIGPHSAAIPLKVFDRKSVASSFAEIFKEAGIHADVYIDPEPEFPEGFLSVFTSPELNGNILMLWPLDEQVTDEIRAVLPKRVPWS